VTSSSSGTGARNIVEPCFNKLKQWRGLAMRSDKTARNHHSGQCLAATLHWVQTFSNTAQLWLGRWQLIAAGFAPRRAVCVGYALDWRWLVSFGRWRFGWRCLV